MGENSARMTDLAALRQMAYSLLSAVFLGTWRDTAEQLGDTAAEVLEISGWAANMAFYPALSDFLRNLSELDADSVGAAEGVYQRMFGPTPSWNPIPLNETSYLVPGAEETGYVLASVERHYASAGVELTAASGNIPDHIAVELEFIAYLCGSEAAAWSDDNFKDARRMQDRQRRFLDQHPSAWVPVLLREITARDDGLLASTAVAAHAQITHDLDFLRALQPLMRSAT